MLEQELLAQLSCNSSKIDEVLSTLPITITRKNECNIRFDVFGHSSSAYTMDMSTLNYYNFRENKRGNLFDLMSELLEVDKDSVIADMYLSVMCEGINKDVEVREYNCGEYSLEYPNTYELSCLEEYPNVISGLFLKDNIWVTTQIAWDIRYDFKYKRVVIPVYQDGELVGALGRLNKNRLEDSDNKYMPTLVYSKSKVLFGLDMYRDKIKERKTVILVESEKSVLKAWQHQINTPVLAVGGSNISRHHIERLNILGVENIMWAQDKGIDEDKVLLNNLRKLTQYSNAKNIYYLDVDNCSELEDKESIMDKDKETIKEVLKNYTIKIK